MKTICISWFSVIIKGGMWNWFKHQGTYWKVFCVTLHNSVSINDVKCRFLWKIIMCNTLLQHVRSTCICFYPSKNKVIRIKLIHFSLQVTFQIPYQTFPSISAKWTIEFKITAFNWSISLFLHPHKKETND